MRFASAAPSAMASAVLMLSLSSMPPTPAAGFVAPLRGHQSNLKQHPKSVSLNVASSVVSSNLENEAEDLDAAREIPSASKRTAAAYLPPRQVPEAILSLPKHSHHPGVNDILTETENIIRKLHQQSQAMEEKSNSNSTANGSMNATPISLQTAASNTQRPTSKAHDDIFANTYVDLGKVDTIGFDYDYTLMSYTVDLLDLIYDMALDRLVNDRQYPLEMLKDDSMQFDPFFSIRGLAVDKETGWICHLSYTHKVAVAWEGREKVKTSRIYEEYRGKRALTPVERKKRLKPLNDLFSMAECCLIADTIQYFKDQGIDYCPNNAVTDVLGAIRDTHISGDFHRIVASDPEKYFDPSPNLKIVLEKMKEAGKRLMFVSNSPYWYVDAGMKHVLGEEWMNIWDAVIVSAGKPVFYTETKRPFREVNKQNSRIKFKRVDKFEKNAVYTEGCLRELTRLMDWSDATGKDRVQNKYIVPGALSLATSNVLYIGDSLFADLVDAKREFGWITAAVTPEVGYELDIQQQSSFVLVERTIEILLNALRLLQTELGPAERTEEDQTILDALEKLVSRWRDRETALLGNPFGSVFRARYQPSLFAHSLRRYCDMYMSQVGAFANYSPQHRFYPESDFRLLAHEIRTADQECWVLEDVLGEAKPEADAE